MDRVLGQTTHSSAPRHLMLPSPFFIPTRPSCYVAGCQRSSRATATRQHRGLHRVSPPLPLPSSPHHQVLMLRGGIPALITGYSHGAAERAWEAQAPQARQQVLTTPCCPIPLLLSGPRAAVWGANADHGLQPRRSRAS
ncbi:unnamed protein product [Closterium sp. NIES-54]